MADTWGDGWNNNILGFKQNDTIVGKFGDNFDSGRFSLPVFVTVVGNVSTQVVVAYFGAYTHEI